MTQDELQRQRETEKIARRMANEAGQPAAMWELFLIDAYREHYRLAANDVRNPLDRRKRYASRNL